VWKFENSEMKKQPRNVPPKGYGEISPLGDRGRDRFRWLGVPFQMAATVLAGYLAGSWLDEKYATEKNYWTMGLTLFAVLVSLYQLIRQVMEK